VTPTINTDEHGHSPFRAAFGRKDFEGAADTLAPDVRLRSPILVDAFEGREAAAFVLRAFGEVLGPELAYQWQVREGDREVLFFTSRVDEHEVQGVDILRFGEDGLVAELIVMIRPMPALAAVGKSVGAKIAELMEAAR
jgi:hypothetical protein